MNIAIVVPSRKRPHNMPTLRALLPSAIICVDERELADYKAVVPLEQLLVHPPITGLPGIVNWIQEAVAAPILFVVDDDFVGVQCLVGSHRFITEPADILTIIENAAQVCGDLGLSTFCFTRTANVSITHPEFRPIRAVQAVANARGFMGAARHRKLDVEITGRADIDWTLQTLLDDRIVYADMRFYFDCGPVFSGRGGAVGVITPEVFERSSLALKHRWGDSVSFKAPAFVRKQNVTGMSIRVSRTSKLAQK